ncbi:hypothetical protein OWV82_019947 [Melia azedarach]|uniref:Uncharacterized protein n=1 Tax=Melia azedarach TaxID=155640 RepID=A0ACC1X540_MELAZ|nr:hypothetical protein OWV82_019947 [Melia azedarach]
MAASKVPDSACSHDNEIRVQDCVPTCSQQETKQWISALLKQNGKPTRCTAKIQEDDVTQKIQKVPKIIREMKGNDESYDPLVVSVGPYHHRNPKLVLVGKQYKCKLACEFANNDQQMLEEAYAQVMDLAKSAKECMDQKRLILAGNQLPFKVLEKLMMFKLRDKEEWKKMLDDFIQNILLGPQHNYSKQPQGKQQQDRLQNTVINVQNNLKQAEPETEPAHLLAYTRTKLIGDGRKSGVGSSFWSSFRSAMEFISKAVNRKRKNDQPNSWSSYRSAQELKLVGINFKPSKNHQLRSVEFRECFLRDELYLPPMTVDDSTKSLLLNMVAYEACADSPDDFVVTSYICLLDSLIDHAEDVKELRSQSILLNFLGSDQQVADLFNEIADNLVPNPDIFADIRENIERHYKNKMMNWMAEFWHTHFSSPWTVLAFLGAIFALVLSVIQTYETVFPPGPIMAAFKVPDSACSHDNETRVQDCVPTYFQETKQWLSVLLENEINPTKRVKIQKIPQIIREKKNNRSYDPSVVSIGPFHHGNPKLELMEKHKFKMACEFAGKNQQRLEEAYTQVMALAKSARECYEDDEEGTVAKFNDEEFTNMMFLDGCFVVQFIYCWTYNHDDHRPNDTTSLGMKSNIEAWVKRDLFLLENQLPFKILEKLMMLKFKNDEEETWKTKLGAFVQNILGPQRRSSKKPQAEQHSSSKQTQAERQGRQQPQGTQEDCQRFKVNMENEPEPAHLLAYTRTELIGKKKNKSERKGRADGDDWSSYRSATELKMAGINFKPSESHQLLSVKFNGSIFRNELCLPSMTVDDSTESLLLNMVAYEACTDSTDNVVVTSYICFLDSLIDHAADVKLLGSKGILHNFLGSDEQVAILFNEMADNLVPNQQIYADIRPKIEKHYNNKFMNWLAEFWHTHFTSPWTILAFLGAILALVLFLTTTTTSTTTNSTTTSTTTTTTTTTTSNVNNNNNNTNIIVL